MRTTHRLICKKCLQSFDHYNKRKKTCSPACHSALISEMFKRKYQDKQYAEKCRAARSTGITVHNLICAQCHSTFTHIDKRTKTCSKECTRLLRSENLAAQRQSASFQAGLSSYLSSEKNPLRGSQAREKSLAIQRAKGFPNLRGGNGAPLPDRQIRLARLLSAETEVSVALGDGERPHHYLVDVGIERLRLAIEIDGQSHKAKARQQQDRRKDTRLNTAGWTVLRFWNSQLDEELDQVATEIRSTISRLERETT